MKNIYLVGFMGSGKTTVAGILAERLAKEFLEMDAVIAEREGLRIVDIFAKKGEVYFRKLERELLKELSAKEDLVISCGGGLICDKENLKRLRETGTVFCLKASALTTYERINKHTHRPILNVDNPQEKIKQLLEERAPYYAQAHYSIDTDNLSPEEIANRIISILNNG